ncbi:RING finger and transmembrane domain-containing protein 2 [Copidosoma floridanum]|uniref:RING finger and transmembrane domain-containing protein 2 n=1 Tax=Copidosoma floridanum TaxID=29053 RepID=UPI0006C94537|nr:RING finger and transmembrane domain-containing protein 2 [Copidosoma floridanum]XP_014204821.1 RING finger and transmembrane domain-containing protein 2 [Copidosoma floridanum]XP_014204822.1 RING finger and transmembrane domain-containing protein 2 [Copidosoma floridanum]XP_014204825.1 RING finger and transmembrane domain-containing protein 2 [Copidosoma floridanum]XP_023247851.1 RING finger and transmembrane domain-containing protein 2 [Copidosoma floridanum]
MADTAITVEEAEPESEPRRASTTESAQSTGILMTHSHPPPNSNTALATLGFHFNPMEDSRRIIANNLSSIGEISPLISLSRSRPALSIQEWLNPNHQRQLQPLSPVNERDSVGINIDNLSSASSETHQSPSSGHEPRSFGENFVNNSRGSASNGNANANSNNNDDPEANPSQSLALNAEARATQKSLEHYLPFLTIILTKFVYDNVSEILNFVLLVVTFIQANNDLKREIVKQQNRNFMSLFGIICYSLGCLVFINFVFKEPIFISYTTLPMTLSELLWIIVVSDYVLKLTTVAVKVVLTSLPAGLLPLQKRGKFYLLIEATSQLYRCFVPVKPWLHYLYTIYDGPDKVLGVILFIMYGMHKGGDILSHIKLLLQALWKVFQNVSLGVCPSKEQIVASGGVCAICHEEYSAPVKLLCKHIFCESCVTTWLDRERSCPLCRASITDDPIYRDGHTTHFIQLY